MREEWTEARIDELGNGLRPVLKAGPFGSSVTKATYHASGYKVYGQQEVVAKDLNAEAYFVSESTFRRHKGCVVKPGDLLMTMMGTIGRVYRVPEGAPEGIINPRLVRIAFDASRILPEYAEAALEQPPLQRLLDRRSHGGTMQGLNLHALASIRLPLPPLPEQRKIAAVLRTWDTAIQKTEQLIAAKERRYCALSGQLLFGLKRFNTYATSGPKTLHWFSVSSEWSIVEIGEIAREVSAVNDTTNDLPVLSCTKYHGLVDSLQYFKKQVFSHDTSKYKLVRRGQFAYATNHIEEGSIGYQDFVAAGLVSPIYTVFQADASRVDDGYLYKLLKTEKLRQLFAAKTNASVDRRGSLRWKEFARIHIPLPPLEEQRRISTLLDTANQEIDLLREEVAALKTQKRGLMQKLLTGQWRLPLASEEHNHV